MNRFGYSLVELLLALSLLCLLIVVASSCLRIKDSLLVRAELDLFLTTCRYMQIRAQLEQTDKELQIDQVSHSYSFEQRVHFLPKQVRFSSALDAQGPPSDPHKIIIVPVTFAQSSIRFFADGSLQAGAVYFSTNVKSCLYALTIPIAEISCLRTYRYDQAVQKWHLLC